MMVPLTTVIETAVPGLIHQTTMAEHLLTPRLNGMFFFSLQVPPMLVAKLSPLESISNFLDN